MKKVWKLKEDCVAAKKGTVGTTWGLGYAWLNVGCLDSPVLIKRDHFKEIEEFEVGDKVKSSQTGNVYKLTEIGSELHVAILIKNRRSIETIQGYTYHLRPEKLTLYTEPEHSKAQHFNVGEIVYYRFDDCNIKITEVGDNWLMGIGSNKTKYQLSKTCKLTQGLNIKGLDFGQGDIVEITSSGPVIIGKRSKVWHSINDCQGLKRKKKAKALKLIEALEKDNRLADRALYGVKVSLSRCLHGAFNWGSYGPSYDFWQNIYNKL